MPLQFSEKLALIRSQSNSAECPRRLSQFSLYLLAVTAHCTDARKLFEEPGFAGFEKTVAHSVQTGSHPV